MTTPPTFTTGQVLTANMMNQAGLWLVAPTAATNGTISGNKVTVGSAVGSVTVTAFTSAYSNYRIIWNGGSCSTGGVSSRITFGSASTGYYGSQPYWTAAGGSGANAVNNGSFLYCGSQDSVQWGLTLDVLGPYTSTYTQISGFSSGGAAVTLNAGYLANTTSYTSFTITAGAGTFTGGTISVYGYNQ